MSLWSVLLWCEQIVKINVLENKKLMDVPEENVSADELKKGDRISRNKTDECQKDEVTTHEVCDDLHGKKNYFLIG